MVEHSFPSGDAYLRNWIELSLLHETLPYMLSTILVSENVEQHSHITYIVSTLHLIAPDKSLDQAHVHISVLLKCVPVYGKSSLSSRKVAHLVIYCPPLPQGVLARLTVHSCWILYTIASVVACFASMCPMHAPRM